MALQLSINAPTQVTPGLQFNGTVTVNRNSNQIAGGKTTFRIRFEPTGMAEVTGTPTASNDTGVVTSTYSNSVLTANASPGKVANTTSYVSVKGNFQFNTFTNPGSMTLYCDVQVLDDQGRVKDSGTVSRQISLSNPTYEDPNRPTNFTATGKTTTTVLVTWTAPANASYTRIYRRVLNTGGYVKYGETQSTGDKGIAGSGNLSYLDTGLTPNTSYQYYLEGVREMPDPYSGSGTILLVGSNTNALTATTAAVPPAPAAVTNINGVGLTTTSIQVSFTPAPNVTVGSYVFPNTYTLKYSTSQGGPYTTGITSGEDDPVVTQTGLTANTLYYCKIVSTNDGGSTDSAEFQVRTKKTPGVPTTPSNFTATAATYRSVTLTWTDNATDETSFGLAWGPKDAGTFDTGNVILPANSTSYTVTGLTPGDEYDFALFASNSFGFSDTVITSGTGVPPRAVPDAPSVQVVTAINSTSVGIQMQMTPGATDGTYDGFRIFRSSTEMGVYVQVGEIAATSLPGGFTIYIDSGLNPSTTYWYKTAAYNEGGTGAYYPTAASVTTPATNATFAPVCPFTLHPDSNNEILEVAGRVLITSDRDRWIVRTSNGSWYKAGLKPMLTGGTLSATTGGVLQNGTYTAYVVLFRSYDQTRSLPSPASNEYEINDNNRTLVLTLPLNDDGDALEVRDIGYDFAGNQIAGCDYFEIYLAEQNQPNAYRVGIYPIEASEWETTAGVGDLHIDNTLTLLDIFGSTRRPMELLGENSLPPSTCRAIVRGSRIITFGDVSFKPTDDERASDPYISINPGDKSFTVTNWEIPEAAIYHQLVINGSPTNWEIYDIEGTTAYIRNPDPILNEKGFEGAGGTIRNFELAGTPGRVYLSAYYSGEAEGAPTFSYETFPPLTTYEAEFSSDDNSRPLAIIGIRDDFLVGKDDKWVLARGGHEPDAPLLATEVISRSSGVNAPESLALDTNDTRFYLGDTGPYMANQSGVNKVNVYTGNKHLFRDAFDMASIADACGAWFSREDWYVVTNINRKGNGGRFDGFVLDPKNGVIMPFTTPVPVTYIKEFKSSQGEFQLMFGTTDGRVGYLFKRGLYHDMVDYTAQVPTAGSSVIKGYVRGGITDADHGMTVRYFRPRINSYPYETEFACSMGFDYKDRMASGSGIGVNPERLVYFTTGDKRDHFSIAGRRGQQVSMAFGFETNAGDSSAYFGIRDIEVAMMLRGMSA